MAIINQPPQTDVDSALGVGWFEWLNSAFSILSAITMSGTTAQRPTKFLWVGRNFYDMTLGYPVYLHSYAGGVAVWHNGAGAVV